jgi:uncharacterized membrane protein HdeD (DUF308 family)
MVEEQSTNPEKKEEKSSPWQDILIGLVLIAGGYFMYWSFNDMEQNGGSMRINWMFALAYKLGGKYTVASIIALIGVFYSYSGVKDLTSKKGE